MRRFEYIDLAVLSLESGNAQPQAGLTEQLVTETFGQDVFERLSVIYIPSKVAYAAMTSGWKDFGTAFEIEVEESGGVHAGPQAHGDDAASRGPNDKIKKIRD